MSAFTTKPCRNGHGGLRNSRGECVECCRGRDRKRYAARRADPKFRAYQRTYQHDHFQAIKAGDPEAYKARNKVGNEARKRRKAADPEFAKDLHRKSHLATKRRMDADPEYARKRRAASVASVTALRKKSPRVALVTSLRNRLSGAFRTYARGGKVRTSSEYGIDYVAICDHLGPCPGKRSDYHIDHIRPLASFDFDNPDEVRMAFLPENHQWLTAAENHSKGSTFREERKHHGSF